MSQVYNYVVIAVVLTFLLKFMGIPSGADAIITYLGLSSTASGVSLGTFFIGVAAIFTVGVGAGIVTSFFTRTSSETFILAPLCAGIFTMIVSTFVSVVNYTSGLGFVYYIVFIFFVPFIIAFGISIIKFWRGTD